MQFFDVFCVHGRTLTALLARTLIFGKGMKPVKLAKATTPIGKTECGSKPKTAQGI